MSVSTRNLQHERRKSQLYATASLSTAGRLNLTGIDNESFPSSSLTDLPTSHSTLQSPVMMPLVDIAEEQEASGSTTSMQRSHRRYAWKMSHYFYIHVGLFIVHALVGGLIIWLIENYSASRNKLMEVRYIDAWFLSSSCTCSCGLSTIDFARLSCASQMVLMVVTFISGITISTLPALIVKARMHKRVDEPTVDDDHGEFDEDGNDELATSNSRLDRNLPPHIRSQLFSLPNAVQLRYRAYITCIVLILATCFTIYTIAFVVIGSWLQTHYMPENLLQDNSSVNPWYASFIITLTGFNQNGLTPFSTGFRRFVDDVYLNLFVMMLVMSGTSLFPFLLRNVVILLRLLAPWRHKVIFDYILMNNHRLSTLLFPTVQTRIYLSVTVVLYIMGVGISLILDLTNDAFAIYTPDTRVLIFFFQTVNSRFAGFQTVDLTLLATATLVVYLVLMATKPQMLCALDKSSFELCWLELQAREKVHAQMNPVEGSTSTSINNRNLSIVLTSTGAVSFMQRAERFLNRQSLVVKDLARQQFSGNVKIGENSQHKPKHLTVLHIRLFLIYFIKPLLKYAFDFFISTHTWLFVFIFLICAFEYRQMAPVDPNITILHIIFEIVSAFGTVGFTLGYPNVDSSFATVLTSASKVILVITMFMGRHRGLLASMKDQEAIEHSAADLLRRRREEVILQFERSKMDTDQGNQPMVDSKIHRF